MDPHIPSFSVWLAIIIETVTVLLNVAAFLGNSVVLFAFALERKLWQPSNYCIASLTVACLLVSLFCMPLGTTYLIMGHWMYGRRLCQIWIAIECAADETIGYTTFVIMLDRFLSLKFSYKYLHWRSGGKVIQVITGTWAVPVLFSAILGIIWEIYMKQNEPPSDICDLEFQDSVLFSCLHTFFIFWGPLYAACLFYALICKEVLAIKHAAQGQQRMSRIPRTVARPAPGRTVPRSKMKTLGATKNNSNTADRLLGPMGDRVVKCHHPKLLYFNTGHLEDQQETNVKFEHDSMPDLNFNSRLNSSVWVVHFPNSAKIFLDNSNHGTDLPCSVSSVKEGMYDTEIFAGSIHCDFFLQCSENEDRGCFQHCLSRHRFGCLMETHYIFCLPHCTYKNAYDFVVDLPEMQRSPRGTRVSCRVKNHKCLLATFSSENIEWVPSVKEYNIVDSDMIYTNTLPISGRLPLLASSNLQVESPLCPCNLTSEITATSTEETTSTSLSVASIRPPSAVYKYLPQEQPIRLDTLTTLATGAGIDGSEKHGQTPRPGMTPHDAHYLHKENQNGASIDSNKTDQILGSNTLLLVEKAKQPSTKRPIRVQNKRRPIRKKVVRRTSSWLSRRLQNEAIKSLRQTSLILGAFVLFWTPSTVVILIRAFCHDCVSTEVTNFVNWFSYVYCCAFPMTVVYSCMDIKKTVSRILRFDWHRE